MKATVTLLTASFFIPVLAIGQTFTRSTSLLPYAARSGGCTGVADMDGDGRDDIVILDQSRNLYVLYQGATGSFTSYAMGQAANADQWGMAVGDVDRDGHKDFFTGDPMTAFISCA